MGRFSKNDKKNVLRIFVAIDVPKEIARIEKIVGGMDLFEGTYVKPKQAHLTLRFLAYVEPNELAPIKKILSKVKFTPFQLKLGSLGVFEQNGKPSVVWTGVVGSDGKESRELANLANSVENNLSLSMPGREHPFHAHVTIARVNRAAGANFVKRELKSISVEPITFTVDEFVLKQSTLTPDGPVYVDLERFKADRS